MFNPRLALASLSGESDASWAAARSAVVGAAFIGGISMCEATRSASRELVTRGRHEFLPPDPFVFLEEQLEALADEPMQVGVNLRTGDNQALRRAAHLCATYDAIVEINAHCRQPEICAIGAGQRLLQNPTALVEQVGIAATTGADVSVKVRAEIPHVCLPDIAEAIENVGASVIHVDAMDSEAVIKRITDRSELFVIANNGVRDARTTLEYLKFGADAVSVARASDQPAVLTTINSATQDWFDHYRTTDVRSGARE